MSDTQKTQSRYRPTASRFKGGASEMYVTYDLDQRTRGGGHAVYPKVKRVYIAGDVTNHEVGESLRKRTGKEVHGVRIDYEQSRRPYHREGYRARRNAAEYEVGEASVGAAKQRFTQIVELPDEARDIHFYISAEQLPARYRQALQAVR